MTSYSANHASGFERGGFLRCSLLVIALVLIGFGAPRLVAQTAAAPQPTGGICGQAFHQRPDGFVVMAAGRHVYLVKEQEGTAKIVSKLGKPEGDGSLPMGMILATEVVQSTEAGADGRFCFSHVGAGIYYVLSRVSWVQAGVGIALGTARVGISSRHVYWAGGWVARRVVLGSGDHKSVLVDSLTYENGVR